MSVRVPGAFWVALIVFCITWLPQIINANWVDEALIGLYALLKAVEVLVGITQPALRKPDGSTESRLHTSLNRIIFG